MTIRACIRTAAAVAAATALIVTPAAQAATTAQAQTGGCATHIDTPEPLGVNVLGIVCI